MDGTKTIKVTSVSLSLKWDWSEHAPAKTLEIDVQYNVFSVECSQRGLQITHLSLTNSLRNHSQHNIITRSQGLAG